MSKKFNKQNHFAERQENREKKCQFDRFDYQICTPKWAFSGKSINFWFNSQTKGLCFSRFNMFWMLHFGLCICVKLNASENRLTKPIGRMRLELVKLKDEKRNKHTCNVAAFKLRLKNEMWCNVIETAFETADELNFLDFHFNCNLTLNSNEMKKKKQEKKQKKGKIETRKKGKYWMQFSLDVFLIRYTISCRNRKHGQRN